jgi:ABC-type branched-subunit amino acid transport system substrate-binding protein
VPNPHDQFNLGACRYLAEEFPEAVKKAAVIYSDIGAAKNRGKTIVEGCEQAGFDVVYEKGAAIGEQNWGSTVSEMQSEGVEYLNVVTAVPELQNLMVAMQDQGFEPQVIDLGQQYYDPAILESPGSEGAYVLTNTVPFEEADQSPALQVYLHWLEEAAPGTAPTSLGVQAFSAGLLFAQAVKTLGSDVTRDALLDALSAVTEWDGGGLHMVTNPGANEMNACYLYLQVKDAKFERLQPKEGFECDPSANIELEGDYGTGARAGG